MSKMDLHDALAWKSIGAKFAITLKTPRTEIPRTADRRKRLITSPKRWDCPESVLLSLIAAVCAIHDSVSREPPRSRTAALVQRGLGRSKPSRNSERESRAVERDSPRGRRSYVRAVRRRWPADLKRAIPFPEKCVTPVQTVSDRCALLRQPYSLVSPNLHHPGSCAASTVLLNLGTASVRTSDASVDPLLSQFSNARAADSLKKGLAR
jgi:hypothetical protein